MRRPYPDSADAQHKVVEEICRKCPVVLECLADELDSRQPQWGVRGEFTHLERKALLRLFPKSKIPSWGDLFDRAQEEGADPRSVIRGLQVALTTARNAKNEAGKARKAAQSARIADVSRDDDSGNTISELTMQVDSDEVVVVSTSL